MRLNELINYELIDSKDEHMTLHGQQLQDIIGRMYIQGFIQSLPEVLQVIDKLQMDDMILLEDAQTTIRRCFSLI